MSIAGPGGSAQEELQRMNRTSTPTGIQAVGEVPFGTHFCQFYRTRQDLIARAANSW